MKLFRVRSFKYLFRSKSSKFMNVQKDNSYHDSSLNWDHNKVFYSASSSDMTLIYELSQENYES